VSALEKLGERVDQLLTQFPDPGAAETIEFRAAQFDLGLAWVHFREGSGGLGIDGSLQAVVEERLKAAGAPPRNDDYVGMHQAVTAIHAVGTAEQQRRFMRPLFTGEERWCQFFSEPGAGSDLAGLATSAVRDGEEWVVNGQKVWTSGAMDADLALLLARTNPDVPKHRGLTLFVCEMKIPGVEVRPIRQGDGAAHFNEVFLTDVRVPDAFRLGEVGSGWGASLTALHSERQGTGDVFKRPTAELLEAWHRYGPIRPQALKDEVMRNWIADRVASLTLRRIQASAGGEGATALGSLSKIAASEVAQQMSSLLLRILGPDGQVGIDYNSRLDEEGLPDDPRLLAIRSRAMSIEGGTNEVQRNILGEQVLGLPGDIRVDKDRPWKEVPRN
jgi:alkylation response protein AidB-like acyl-CoA dehydrogenase